MLLFDAHLDLSLNALEGNRDLRAAVDTIRQLEQGMEPDPERNANTCFIEITPAGSIRSTSGHRTAPALACRMTAGAATKKLTIIADACERCWL